MKKLIYMVFLLSILACDANQDQVIAEPPGPRENVIEPKEKTAQIYLDTYPFLGNVLLVNEPNDIIVHLSDVHPKKLIVEISQERLDIDEHGKVEFTPTELGTIDLEVYVQEKGQKVSYGKAEFRVMSAETTLGEIYDKKN